MTLLRRLLGLSRSTAGSTIGYTQGLDDRLGSSLQVGTCKGLAAYTVAIERIAKTMIPTTAAAFCFAVLSAGWLGFWLAQPFLGSVSDFPQYYAPAQLIVTGHGSQAYDLKAIAEVQHECFPGMGDRFVLAFLPPPSLIWLWPLGFMPPQVAAIVWQVLQGVALIVALLILRKAFALDAKAFLWLTATLCMSGPAYAAAHINQPSFILLCALSAAVWALKCDRPWWAAIGLSFLMLKPQQGLPLLVYFAGARRKKELVRTAAILAAITAVTCILVGQQGMMDYFRLITSTVDQSALMQTELGPTLRGQLLRLFPAGESLVGIFSAIVCIISLLFIFKSGRRFASHPASVEAGLLIAIPLGLLTCLHLHSYDLVLLAPTAVTILAGPLKRTISPGVMLAGLCLFGAYMVPFYIYIHYFFLVRDHWLVNPHFLVLFAFSIGSACLAYRFSDKIVGE